MATGTITIRLPQEMLAGLKEQAQAEEKTVSEVVRELIESGQTRQTAGSGSSNLELARLKELLIKAVRVGAQGQFYARCAAEDIAKVAGVFSDHLEAAAAQDPEGQRIAVGQMDQDAQNFAEWWLKGNS